MIRSISHKLAIASISSALSCVVLLQASLAKAATYSFTQGGFSTRITTIFTTIPGIGIPPVPANNLVLSGTFTGEDLNGDGVIAGSEVTDASLDFFGKILPIGIRYVPSSPDNDALLSFGGLFPPSTSPSPGSPFATFTTLTVDGRSRNSGFNLDFYGPNGINGFEGEVQGRSSQPIEVTEVVPAASVPEPEDSAMTLVPILGISFLLKKKVSSKKQQLKLPSLQSTK